MAAATSECESPALDIHMATGLIAVAFKVKGTSSLVLMLLLVVAKTFTGKITSWNDLAITTPKSSASLLLEKITIFFRSNFLGTTHNFEKYLNMTNAADYPTTLSKTWTGSYADSGSLSMEQINNGGKPTIASQGGDDLTLKIQYIPTTLGAYPIILFTYETVCSKYSNATIGANVKAFLTYTSPAASQNLLPTQPPLRAAPLGDRSPIDAPAGSALRHLSRCVRSIREQDAITDGGTVEHQPKPEQHPYLNSGLVEDLYASPPPADVLNLPASSDGPIIVSLSDLLAAIPDIAKDKSNFFVFGYAWTSNPNYYHFGIMGLLEATVITVAIRMIITVRSPSASPCLGAWLSQSPALSTYSRRSRRSSNYGICGFMILSPKLQPVQRFFYHFGAILIKDKGFIKGSIFDGDMTPWYNIEAARALGVTCWEFIRLAVLPYGRPGVVSGEMLGLGGVSETFASKIANGAAESGIDLGLYIAAGLVLFGLTFAVNAQAVVNRRKEFSE
ncbi:hypothetical protein QBC33DRAFT_564331 [Phialemonium atrogriseum]|uniref:PBP domain-containing protein n=1 Tax=Phialemonium atrogriseum TaxID=1093897 RepID=A0AAJ0BPV1_9PEZI|nr:uncharacterized protein QBC33DRAFT_564331 [Phialemonium atrogriseum]KAK1761882.1 hypothetical protein QBC33DRAFT_564331 [Phialemonium atrogriseum]